MPVDFLSKEKQARYGCYTGEPTPANLARSFYLDDYDRRLIAARRGDHHKLGFALQLCTVRYLGTFLADPLAVPASVIRHVAAQVGVADPACLLLYGRRTTTWREHAGEIQQVYGYRDFHDPSEFFRLMRWLYARAWLSAEAPSLLFDLATARLVERKVLLPGVTVLARLVARVRDRVAARLWQSLAAAPNERQCADLGRLLIIPADERLSTLERLGRAPTRVSAAGLVEALKRLAVFQALDVSALDLAHIPTSRIMALGRHAAGSWAATVSRMPTDRRIATLLAFARLYEARAQGDALDVLELLIASLFARVEREGDRARLRTLHDLDVAALILRDASRILRDPSIPADALRAMVEARVGMEELDTAIDAVTRLTRPPDDHYYDDVLSRYSMVRQFLPTLLRTVTFDGVPAAPHCSTPSPFSARWRAKRHQICSKRPWAWCRMPGDGSWSRPCQPMPWTGAPTRLPFWSTSNQH